MAGPLLLALGVVGTFVAKLPAAPPSEADLRARVAPLVVDLDSDRFDIRRRAAEALEALVDQEGAELTWRSSRRG